MGNKDKSDRRHLRLHLLLRRINTKINTIEVTKRKFASCFLRVDESEPIPACLANRAEQLSRPSGARQHYYQRTGATHLGSPHEKEAPACANKNVSSQYVYQCQCQDRSQSVQFEFSSPVSACINIETPGEMMRFAQKRHIVAADIHTQPTLVLGWPYSSGE